MIPAIAYELVYSENSKYIKWKKCVVKAKKDGHDIKKCDNIYTAYLLLNKNTIVRDNKKIISFPYDPSQFGELPKNKL
jgi:hypothetical protein